MMGCATTENTCCEAKIETHQLTSEVIAIYLHFRKGRHAETREHANAQVFADYDVDGKLIGVEILPAALIVWDRK